RRVEHRYQLLAVERMDRIGGSPDGPCLLRLQLADEVPSQTLELGKLLALRDQLLTAVLPDVTNAERVELAHDRRRVELGHDDARDSRRVAAGGACGVRDALIDRGEAGREGHYFRNSGMSMPSSSSSKPLDSLRAGAVVVCGIETCGGSSGAFSTCTSPGSEGRATCSLRTGNEGTSTRGCGSPPSKPAATTVTRTSSPRVSSMTVPKMMLASGCAASCTRRAASLISKMPRFEPPWIERSTPCAPSIDASSSGLATASSAALMARSAPLLAPMPMSAEPAPCMTDLTSAKSRLMRPGVVMRSVMPCTPARST